MNSEFPKTGSGVGCTRPRIVIWSSFVDTNMKRIEMNDNRHIATPLLVRGWSASG